MLDPILVTLVDMEPDETLSVTVPHIQRVPAAGTRDIPFSSRVFIDRSDFLEETPRGFKRLTTTQEVGLKGVGYVIKVQEVRLDSWALLTGLWCLARAIAIVFARRNGVLWRPSCRLCAMRPAQWQSCV